MKRRLLVAAVALSIPLTAIPAHAISVSVNGQQVDGVGPALPSIGAALDDIFTKGATFSAAGYKIVYDPRALPEYNEEEAIADVPDPNVTQQTGTTSNGNKVVMPTQGRFTSGFGPRWGTVHQGIDIANDLGTPILAVMDGTVINAGPARGFGKWVRVRHDDGSISVYGHIRSFNVNVGDRVSAGQQIAEMGSEGYSTGSHLHFEIMPDGETKVDPVPWFAERGITV
ncbi:Murein DD-endopeptidase MepM and murein hydrolase activator NlpD, contain LysM domain [Corynebacterium appendicis CIP 107643]|uniref:Murein DD-endopeptidase MepM and murein hydrolase activator NlpD, contain LysM domain n=1 Tax=Corynebacterium appendicis CIP 107643 TaxID=1161099 RepID=A0A1N7JD75_9CORY|nr:M23 family metallopeptidase [Corynebacterium appendicis]MCT1684615.1 M23 family metallopeptidase [Corynebacterium appendicis]WJY60614.1 Murein hydrolase activator NlpD precursor [Corynebacterium appendicis CIP 107643]SIS47303.1 Murein DD-endopeptidase MepM and murein hydrolase activator NlpD, contain LysM domain [Corynebacterium appendicis CIP 107643]